ncbi:SSI family serine proteinase inhibitor [Streptomyces wuyuanensis]|uniref:SSI family serine proteinase inhibitor n=1 Tax=Streptomyces wuyuanensis TaxID=1196353 RepID=UPI00341642F5
MLRRLVLTVAATATASLAALTAAVPTAGAAPHTPIPLPLLEPGQREPADRSAPGDRLTVTTSETGNPQADGTYELTCGAAGGPAGGSHPEAQAACERLAEFATEEQDPFTPVGQDTMCTMQHGGPATARITGTWHGQSVDATFDRSNGCEIRRWETLEPVLPTARQDDPRAPRA